MTHPPPGAFPIRSPPGRVGGELQCWICASRHSISMFGLIEHFDEGSAGSRPGVVSPMTWEASGVASQERVASPVLCISHRETGVMGPFTRRIDLRAGSAKYLLGVKGLNRNTAGWLAK